MRLDTGNVAFDFTIERDHEFGLLIVCQYVAVVAIISRWLLEDTCILLGVRLGLVVRQSLLKHQGKLAEVLQFIQIFLHCVELSDLFPFH